MEDNSYYPIVCPLRADCRLLCSNHTLAHKCVCDGKLRDDCIEKSCFRPCSLIPIPKAPALAPIHHDINHPDHVDSIPIGEDAESIIEVGNKRDDFKITREPSELSPLEEDAVLIDDEKVVRHRKIYVTERPVDAEPIIHPISLTIPVEIKQPVHEIVPPPKRIFKLRKYTIQESEPEIEMVPVTTTVIKPAGVSDDQIIGDIPA